MSVSTQILALAQQIVNLVSSVPAKDAEPATVEVQGCIRRRGQNILHIQEGTSSSYRKYDIVVSENEAAAFEALIDALETVGSLAGTSTQYLVGSRTGNSFEFAGMKFTK
jgi:hypothetical protein